MDDFSRDRAQRKISRGTAAVGTHENKIALRRGGNPVDLGRDFTDASMHFVPDSRCIEGFARRLEGFFRLISIEDLNGTVPQNLARPTRIWERRVDCHEMDFRYLFVPTRLR